MISWQFRISNLHSRPEIDSHPILLTGDWSLKSSVPDFASSLSSMTSSYLSIYLTPRIPNDYDSQGIRITIRRVHRMIVTEFSERLSKGVGI